MGIGNKIDTYLFYELQGRPTKEDETEERMEGKAARRI